MPPTWFFFLRVALAIWGLLWFHMIGLFVLFLWKMHWNFNRDCIESVALLFFLFFFTFLSCLPLFFLGTALCCGFLTCKMRIRVALLWKSKEIPHAKLHWSIFINPHNAILIHIVVVALLFKPTVLLMSIFKNMYWYYVEWVIPEKYLGRKSPHTATLPFAIHH